MTELKYGVNTLYAFEQIGNERDLGKRKEMAEVVFQAFKLAGGLEKLPENILVYEEKVKLFVKNKVTIDELYAKYYEVQINSPRSSLAEDFYKYLAHLLKVEGATRQHRHELFIDELPKRVAQLFKENKKIFALSNTNEKMQEEVK